MAKQTTWYRLDPAELLIEAMDCTPKEWHQRTVRMMKALVKGERGKDPFADKLMDDADEYIGQRRNAGRNGGYAKAARAKSPQRNAGESDNPPQRNAGEHAGETLAEPQRNAGEVQKVARLTRALTDGQDRTVKPMVNTKCVAARDETPPSPIGPSAHRVKNPSSPIGPSDADGEEKRSPMDFDARSFHIDPYGYLRSIPNKELPEFAVWFCHEPNNREARRCYGGFCKERGASTFRAMLEQFIGECRAGEDPDNRGAAFMKRVKEAWT